MSIRLFVFLVLVLAVGGYIGWPYYTLYRIDAALAQGDGRALDELVDWASVRAGIERQLDARGKAAAGGDRPGGAPGGLASLVAPAVGGFLVDAYASPRGLAKLVRESRIAPPAPPPPAAAGDEDTDDGQLRPAVIDAVSYVADQVRAARHCVTTTYQWLRNQFDYLFFTDATTFQARFAPRSPAQSLPLVLTLDFNNLTWRLTRVDLPGSGAGEG